MLGLDEDLVAREPVATEVLEEVGVARAVEVDVRVRGVLVLGRRWWSAGAGGQRGGGSTILEGSARGCSVFLCLRGVCGAMRCCGLARRGCGDGWGEAGRVWLRVWKSKLVARCGAATHMQAPYVHVECSAASPRPQPPTQITINFTACESSVFLLYTPTQKSTNYTLFLSSMLSRLCHGGTPGGLSEPTSRSARPSLGTHNPRSRRSAYLVCLQSINSQYSLASSPSQL